MVYAVSDQTTYSFDVCTFMIIHDTFTVGTQLSKTPDSDSALSNAIEIVETLFNSLIAKCLLFAIKLVH